MANVGDAFNTFFWITFVYFVAKYNIALSDGSGDTKWALGYLLLMIIMMYSINTNLMDTKCGTVDSSVIFRATLLPWILIFGIMIAVLLSAPGWKVPFSNTIGYLIVKLSGGNKYLFKLLNEQKATNCGEGAMSGGVTPEQPVTTTPVVAEGAGAGTDVGGTDVGGSEDAGGSAAGGGGGGGGLSQVGGGKTYRRRSPMTGGADAIKSATDSELVEAIAKDSSRADDVICMVYKDPSPLMNQFTVANFPVAIEKIKNMLGTTYIALLDREDFPTGKLKGASWGPIEKFRKVIYLKDMVAEWIWYILTGSVVIATSDNIIMNSSCAKSVDEQTDYHNLVMSEADNPSDSDDDDDVVYSIVPPDATT